ncbi:MAG: indole-3-glycerol phosphate synthase TrpC [Phycisphaerae bacterium]
MNRTILETIVETKRDEVERARRARPAAELRRRIAAAPPPRAFRGAVVGPSEDIRLIAEIKKASPSAGLIRTAFDPVGIARTYERSGAAALSVLTDETFFQGRLSFVEAVKDAVSLPVLRKDFLIDDYQVLESRAAGADAILLIAGILTHGQIAAWAALAADLGMTSLVEVHDEAQLQAVRSLVETTPGAILGINNRDLSAQSTDLATTERLAGQLPAGTPFVAESGINTRDDVERLHRAGATALLIGETFMRAADVGAKARELFPRG